MASNRIQKAIEFILDNLFDIATIIVAAGLVVRYQIQSPTLENIPELITWILAVLGLLAVSGVWDRNRRLNRIEKNSEEARDLAERFLNRKIYAKDFLLTESKVSDRVLSSAHSITFVGKTLSRTTRDFFPILEKRLVAGADIRFAVIDPEADDVLEQAVVKGFDTTDDYWRQTILATETVIKAIAKTPKGKGRVEIGYLPYIPSFGLILIDQDQTHGRCFVEIYHHRSSAKNPTFEVNAADDPHWYKYFSEQTEILWESCRTKVLKKSKYDDDDGD